MHRNVSTAKQMDCFAIFAVLREFLRMLYAFDSSRNCVVFAYPNICKRTKNTCRITAFEAGSFLRTKACRTRVDCDRQPICVFFLCLQQNYARKSARRFRAKPSGRLYAVLPEFTKSFSIPSGMKWLKQISACKPFTDLSFWFCALWRFREMLPTFAWHLRWIFYAGYFL